MQNTSGGDTDDGEKKNDDDECRCANIHRCGFLTFYRLCFLSSAVELECQCAVMNGLIFAFVG